MTYRQKERAARAWGLTAACAVALAGTFTWDNFVGRPHWLGVFVFGMGVGHFMRVYVERALLRGHP